jgi:hypothetical protein
MAEHDDKTVKELLGSATRADLERWFSLPSFEQLADEGKQAARPDDPATDAARTRHDAAVAAADPVFLAAHDRRTTPPDGLIRFKAVIEVGIDPEIALLDLSMIERPLANAEPREVEIPVQLEDDLKTCTPQALLRDLHRAELTFHKTFEVVDFNEDLRFDLAGAVAEAMAPRQNVARSQSPLDEARALIREAHRDRRQPWAAIAELPMPNRRSTP